MVWSSREGMMHLRRGLHPLRYRGLHPIRYQGVHGLRYHLHVRRAHLLTMRATTELPDQLAALE